jgi:hypothetical protein
MSMKNTHQGRHRCELSGPKQTLVLLRSDMWISTKSAAPPPSAAGAPPDLSGARTIGAVSLSGELDTQ